MSKNESKISVELLNKLLSLDFETGLLFWRSRSPDMFIEGVGRYTSERAAKIWNTRYSGKQAFTSDNGRGYRRGTIFYIDILAHRVVWALHYGHWPIRTIDHINGITTDNRIENLRDVSQDENMKNQRFRSTNTTGITGVWHCKKLNKYDAYISINGKRKHIGRYANMDLAISARKEYEVSNGFHKNHGRKSA